VEQGDHTSLLEEGGLYRRLYALQFTDAPTEAEPSEPSGPPGGPVETADRSA
jgi:hypothetical protein